jgi:hypothetical protein
MSNLGPMGSQRQPGLPTPPKGEPIARYATYLEAQRAVDFLSDNQFPVQFVTIVGSGLRMVERVTGRLTYGRVALAGAASGAWFGLFVGLLMSMFGSSFPPGVVVASMAIGSAFGILFGVISYALTGGRRDFTSTSQIVASEYEVLCMPDHARAAVDLLQRLPGGTGGRSPALMRAAPYGPPPTGVPSPGAGPGQPGGPPAPPGWTPATSTATAATPAGPGPDAATASEPAAVTGPTYGEMIERRRREQREQREQLERERLDRERQRQEALGREADRPEGSRPEEFRPE